MFPLPVSEEQYVRRNGLLLPVELWSRGGSERACAGSGEGECESDRCSHQHCSHVAHSFLRRFDRICGSHQHCSHVTHSFLERVDRLGGSHQHSSHVKCHPFFLSSFRSARWFSLTFIACHICHPSVVLINVTQKEIIPRPLPHIILPNTAPPSVLH
jgi:hypothetical protein